MIIGITGGSGSGKSFVSKIFAQKGFRIVDADEIAKEIMDIDLELKENIRKCFGDEFITRKGEVDRRALGKVVFADPEKRRVLNSLTHPKILEEIERRALQGGNVVIDIPLLKGSAAEKICDLKVAVLASRETRLSRIMSRDGIDPETAINRINSQLTDSEYIESTDLQIINNGNEDEIIKQINDIIKRYCK